MFSLDEQQEHLVMLFRLVWPERSTKRMKEKQKNEHFEPHLGGLDRKGFFFVCLSMHYDRHDAPRIACSHTRHFCLPFFIRNFVSIKDGE